MNGWAGLMLLIGIGLASSPAFAQTTVPGVTVPGTSVWGTVSGEVRDAAGRPLEFVTMLLLRANDSTLVKGAISDASGQYTIDNVAAGSYRVATSLVGYQKVFSAVIAVDADHPKVIVPALGTKEDTRTLGEVKVTAKKPFIEQLADKTVVNVENSIVSSGGNALEVLEKAPGVQVDSQNDRISLKGRDGVLIMIDGKQTFLSAAEVTNLLRNTPSNSIQSIEIITNPSAKYDAAGNSGIINIKMKRGTNQDGTNGSASLGGGYGRLPKANGGLTLNHRQGNWALFGNYNYDYREAFGTIDAYRYFKEGNSVRNKGYRPSEFSGHTFKTGADYFLGKKNTFGFMLNGMVNSNRAQINNDNYLYDSQNSLQSLLTMINTSKRTMQRLAGNVNYKHTFDSSPNGGSGKELTMDLDYSRFSINPRDNMVTRTFNAVNEETAPALFQRNTTQSEVIIRAAKLDYVHPLGKSAKLEAGWKSSYVTTDNDVRFEQQTAGDWQIDPNRTNQFVYNETIHAAYLNGSKDWGKWSVQGGLRMEHTNSVGNSVTMNKVVDRSYTNLFPSVFVTQNISKDHQLRYSYSRRIDRPSYQDLNPFIYILDPYTFTQGNPFLRPQYTNALQAAYTYKGATNISLGYNRTLDVITHLPEQNDETKVTRQSVINLNTLHNYSLSVGFPVTITKWWNMRQSIDLYYNKYNAEYLNQKLDYSQLAANLTMNHNFVLPNGFTAELSGFYSSPGLYGILKPKSIYAVNMGVQKSFWDKKANLRVNVNDIFFTQKFRGVIDYGNLNLRFLSTGETRVVRATFTYNFGNRNIKSARQRRTSVEDEQGRVGQ
ncbi:outer membrane beta-barrel family protein [Nibrella saemangeumensis]|uniref:Outer membrane beta-barrel family protein n=2 Tax=Nibrella saemangeumensis TaxID=1084526 RepID=A0ABP8NIL9_9BACT